MLWIFYTLVAFITISIPLWYGCVDNGRQVVVGTDAGVYVGSARRDFVKIIPRERVSQVDVLEDERILLVLAEKHLLAYGLEALEANDPNSPNKRAKKLGSSVSFFKTGVCQNRTLVGIVKNSNNALDQSSTIKTLEPIEQDGSKRSKHSLRTMLRGGNAELFKLYKVLLPPPPGMSKLESNALTMAFLFSPTVGLLYPSRNQFTALLEKYALRWL